MGIQEWADMGLETSTLAQIITKEQIRWISDDN